MNNQRDKHIFDACLMGILSGVGFGLFYAMTDGGGWHRAVVTGAPFGLVMALFTIVRSYNSSRWFWIGILAIGFGARVCLQKLFGM